MSLSIENDNTIKIYPGPGKAALLAGDDVLFRAWTLLRPQTVSGCVPLATVLEIFAAIGLARSAWYRLLEHPHFDTYFTFDDKKNVVYFHSLLKLCEHYNTNPGFPVYAPISKFHRMQTFRAAVYASQFSTKTRRIGRSTLAKESGASPTSQRTYEKLEEVIVTPNFVFDYPENSAALPIPPTLAEQNDSGYLSRLANGEEVLIWQTVNSYRNEKRSPAPTGQARKIARSVRSPSAYAQRRQRRTSYFVPKITRIDRNRTCAALVGSAYHVLGHSFSGDVWFSIPAKESL